MFDAALFTCPSCGAEIAADNTTAATFCYYCQNPVVLTGRLDGKFMPRRLIPFKINKDSAIEKFISGQGRKISPKDFYSKNSIDKLTGVYFPYWIIDCDTKSDLVAEGKKIRSWIWRILNILKLEFIILQDMVTFILRIYKNRT